MPNRTTGSRQANPAREADKELAARLEGTLDYGSPIPMGDLYDQLIEGFFPDIPNSWLPKAEALG